MSTINVNSIAPESGTTITIGGSGDTVTLGSGASASGFASGIVGVSTFTSSGTWTKATREAALGVTIKRVIVEVQGAGGSGAGSPDVEDVSGGGGGGYARKILDVSSISSATITVGTGGTGVSATSINAGNTGGNSSWADGTNTITGNGGNGGDLTHDTPTTGGTATGGDINIQGGYGGVRFSGNGPFYGGPSMMGFGDQGKHVTRTTVAQSPVGYGSGSGGSNNVGSTENAADGIVIVWEIAG